MGIWMNYYNFLMSIFFQECNGQIPIGLNIITNMIKLVGN
jgi:hypothetical protein